MSQTNERRALLIVNRRARQGRSKSQNITEQLRALGFAIVEATPQSGQEISDLIRQHSDRVDLVIIGGGDGTLNAAIEGLIETQLPLGIIPLGTANDLARTLDIPTELPDAYQVIAAGYQERIDLGKVNDRYFFNVASLGLSVQITRNLTKDVKRRWGVFAYAMTAARALWNARPVRATLWIDGQERRQVRSVQIAVGNGRYYGGGMAVAEFAAIDDQRLDVYSLNIDHWWQLVPILPDMRSGRHVNWRAIDHIRCQSIEIETPRPLKINTDGELTTQTPARFQVLPLAISVFVPSGSGGHL